MARSRVGPSFRCSVLRHVRRPSRPSRRTADGSCNRTGNGRAPGRLPNAALGYVRNRLVPVALTLGRKNLIRLADVIEFRKRRQGGEFTNRRLFPFGDE